MPRIVPSQIVSFIESAYPSAHQESKGADTFQFELDLPHVGQLQALLHLIEQLPNELLTLPAEEYVRMLVGIEKLRGFIKARTSFPNTPVYVGHKNDRPNPITVVLKALRQCRDEASSRSSSELAFIEDAEFREAIRTDLGSIEAAVRNGEWKAATVLAGSVVEALLLWRLKEPDVNIASATTAPPTSPRKPTIDHWDLIDFINVAEELGTIKNPAATQARLAKDFRNLIHPGRSSRLGQVCDRGTALSACAAVEHIIRELTP